MKSKWVDVLCISNIQLLNLGLNIFSVYYNIMKHLQFIYCLQIIINWIMLTSQSWTILNTLCMNSVIGGLPTHSVSQIDAQT